MIDYVVDFKPVKFTYQSLVDATVNYIMTHCYNISNYGDLPAYMRPGWVYKVYLDHAWSGTWSRVKYRYDPYYQIVIVNPIQQYSRSVVESDLTNFLKSVGITNFNQVIDFNMNLSFFVQNLLSFVSSKLKYVASEAVFAIGNHVDSIRYLIYLHDNPISISHKYTLPSEMEIIKADDMYKLIEFLYSNLLTISSHHIKYQYSANTP